MSGRIVHTTDSQVCWRCCRARDACLRSRAAAVRRYFQTPNKIRRWKTTQRRPPYLLHRRNYISLYVSFSRLRLTSKYFLLLEHVVPISLSFLHHLFTAIRKFHLQPRYILCMHLIQTGLCACEKKSDYRASWNEARTCHMQGSQQH